MSEAEREALPDPCRPINAPVVPAGVSLAAFLIPNSALMSDSFATTDTLATPTQPTKNTVTCHTDDTDLALSYPTQDIARFIREQQQQSQHQPCGLRLPLGLVGQLVRDGAPKFIETSMTDHSDLHLFQPPSDSSIDHAQSINHAIPIEARLYMMAQTYQCMLCVFLLVQCKSRKTLNPQITLQDIADAINDYIEAHRLEIDFASHYPNLAVDSRHVEFALRVMGWPTSHQANLAKRVTTISAKNPLTGC